MQPSAPPPGVQVKSLWYGKLKAKSTRAPSLLGFFIHHLAAHPGGPDCPAARSEAYALALKQHAAAVGRTGHDSSSDDEMTEAMDGVTPKQEAEGAETLQQELPLPPSTALPPPVQAYGFDGTAVSADGGADAAAVASGISSGAGEAAATMDTGLDHTWAQAEDAGDAQGWLALVYDALRDGEEAEDAGAHSGRPSGSGQGQQGWASPPALDDEWEPTGERQGWSAPLPAVGLAAEGRELGRGFAAHAEEWLARSGPVPAPVADLPDSPSVPAPAFAPGSWQAGSSQPPSRPPASLCGRLAQRAAVGHSWAPSEFPGHLPGSSTQPPPLASSGRHAHPPTAPQPCASAYAPPPHAASTAYFGDGYYGGWFDDGTSSAPELHTPRRATDGGMYAPPSGPMQSPQPPFYPPPCPSCCSFGVGSSGPSAAWSTVEGTGGPAAPGHPRFDGRWAPPPSRTLAWGSPPRSCSLAAAATAPPEEAPEPMGGWAAGGPFGGDLETFEGHPPRWAAAAEVPRDARCMPHARQSDPGMHWGGNGDRAIGMMPQPPSLAAGPRRLPSDLQRH
ncbi:hypothetical protein HYH03_012014 [Edaphochlamys debaryana]|uniref:Uncharacterized protein n=1 Tax=Edaphochlamys debaryana TaxID=47281 RepID=A0A835XV28_9CHLO|nr:hypothetical protein HYH03_012014 [Edaphochlamys debaryana]|eukprot:KAG2489563.1 hypothetical protein HYH03_012014 [Edaphochlamys debaryana]